MNFISIPPNGSSWQEPLIYSFASEDGSTTDILVEIRDDDLGELMATKRLYGVATAQIDIAPYLRSLCNIKIDIPESNAIVESETTKRVTVVVNGTESPSLIFFARALDTTKYTMLSSLSGIERVERGNMVLFSLFAPTRLSVVLTIYTPSSRAQQTMQWTGSNRIVDIVVHTANIVQDATSLMINIYGDGLVVKSIKCDIVERGEESRQLLWRNSQGGVESYCFPYCRPIARSVEVESLATQQGDIVELRDAVSRLRLLSALETREYLDQLSEMILSPYIYECVSDKLHPVSLERRAIEYDSQGRLRQLALEITQEWKGGGQL